MKLIIKQLLFTLCFFINSIYSQTGIIKGKIYNKQNREQIAFANVVLQSTQKGSVTNENGEFEIVNLVPGFYNVIASYIGFETKTIFEIEVFNSKVSNVNVGLNPSAVSLEEIVVNTELFSKDNETPLSVKTLGVAEIERSPGGGRDISRVVQTLPGVASSPASNRNDIIIRGGGPSENRFYIDGFEVNAINHFTTQGASGGVWGMIDANHIDELKLISGAFPAYSSNVLSSVFDIKLKEGNFEKFDVQLSLGIMQRGINLSGYIGENTTFFSGVRQLNFDIVFPNRTIIPKFTDLIIKSVTNIDKRNKLELFGFSAIDDLNYNTNVEKTDEHLYTLERVRRIQQYTYTFGAKWTKFWENGYTNLILSQNVLNNEITKYENNDPTKKLILDYNSNETENKLVLKNELYLTNLKLNFGLNYEIANYNVSNNSFLVKQNRLQKVDFDTDLDLHKYGFYLSGSSNLLSNMLVVSLGLRSDANNFSDEYSNIFKQLSPRISLSFSLLNNLTINGSSGVYYQNPTYSSLGFTDNNSLINKANKIKPIKSTHFNLGIEYVTLINSSLTLEVFYKKYQNYLYSVEDNISLANKGAGFGVYGAEELTSTSEGRSYGLEFMYQQKLYKGFYGIFAYTFVKSEFTNGDEKYTPSSWDYGNIISLSLGKRFPNNWEIGSKWIFYGGRPYTPFDISTSSLKENWDTKNQGILDYSQLNTLRTNSYHQLDIRIDKKFYFSNFNLNLYIEIQNVFDYSDGLIPNLILDRDENYEPQDDPINSDSYLTKIVEQEGLGVRPNIGFIIEL